MEVLVHLEELLETLLDLVGFQVKDIRIGVILLEDLLNIDHRLLQTQILANLQQSVEFLRVNHFLLGFHCQNGIEKVVSRT